MDLTIPYTFYPIALPHWIAWMLFLLAIAGGTGVGVLKGRGRGWHDLLQQPTFAVHAHEPWRLVPAVIFCSGVVLLVGAGLERAVRALRSRVLRWRRPK